jgi:hypothetical protein
LLVVLKISKPLAGDAIAFCWLVVMRGISRPLVELLISNIALTSGKLPFPLIETFWAETIDGKARLNNRKIRDIRCFKIRFFKKVLIELEMKFEQ